MGGYQASAIIRLALESTKKETFVLSILPAAGWPTWPLILCPVLLPAVVIEHPIQLQTPVNQPVSASSALVLATGLMQIPFTQTGR